ncbi:MAG: alpha/beta hydrolase [Candidatus Kapabacteria bacterium]|nr:alpha/beta hydrolase [Candidatus Kapabacteria bacterium]
MHNLAIILMFFVGSIAILAQPYVDVRYTAVSENDIAYTTATAFNGRVDTLRMNVYYPTDDGAASRPLVLWVHGGGFTGGNRAEMNALCKRWAERGYVAATISYRLGFYGPFPFDPPFAYDTSEVLRAVYRGVQDFRSALKYLVTNASRYNIDTSRTVVGGVSAGAIISLHASFVDDKDVRLPSLGNISPVVRGSESFARPDVGSLLGQSYPGTPLPTIRAVVNIFGALTDITLLQGAPFVPTYSYHQRADPVVPCAIDKGLWGLPFNVSANYAQLVGSCALTAEFEKRGIPTDQYESWIYEGAGHALHDERRIDSAATVFCARMIQKPVSVVQDNEGVNDRGPWMVVDLQGAVVGQVQTLRDIFPFADGVYAAVSLNHRALLCISAGQVAR